MNEEIKIMHSIDLQRGGGDNNRFRHMLECLDVEALVDMIT